MIIGRRFNGPPGSANGGYCAGLIASHPAAAPPDDLGGVEVTLRMPPPLGRPLSVEGGLPVRVYSPDRRLVAEAAPVRVPPELVEPISWAEAVTVSVNYHGFDLHPFPTCFVCGPERHPGDGLRIFPGPVGDGRTAAPWRAPADISPLMVWAALDCPGGWAVISEARPFVLGRIAARVDTVPEPGSPCVVVGEAAGEDGRKAYVRSTLYGPDGAVLAHAAAVWIRL